MLAGCVNGPPAGLGISDGRLAPCPDSPNCVSSDAADPEQRVAPLVLAVDPQQAWEALAEELEEMPRTRIVEERERYLHAEVWSLVFRFVDDVEFHLRPADGIVAVRSAARVGHWDLGVNRRRVEAIRRRLRARGAVR